MSEEKSLLEKLSESRPAKAIQQLGVKVQVPHSKRKVPRGDYESASTKKWPWNRYERKKRRLTAKESRKRNRRK